MTQTGKVEMTFAITGAASEPTVEIVEVVRTRLTKAGDGTEGNPARVLTQYWSPSGELLAIADPLLADYSQ
jgi:hypothetical protein